MADLSKIKLNGTVYNFKDNYARTNFQTAAQVNTAIANALAGIAEFSIEVVQSLPATGDNGTFYFVASNSGTTNNIYDEYVYVNSSWEKIGTTEMDLSNYLKTSDIAAWAKAANKPAYTASEVGAMATSHPAAAITSANISSWNNKSDFSGSYNDLSDKPTIPAATTVTNTLASGTLIATINGTNIYAPSYTNGDNLSYGGN